MAGATWLLVPHWPSLQWWANSEANIQYSDSFPVPDLGISRTEPPHDDVDMLSFTPPWNAHAGPQTVSVAGRRSR